MLHFYTYYSVGGYKELYLGNNSSNVDRTFYLPLLSVEREQAEKNKDKELSEKVERQCNLPSIKRITNTNRYGWPTMADTLITHGSYLLIYTHIADEKFIISIRGICGNEKDETGRPIPYMFAIMSDNIEDLVLMNHIATYISKDLNKSKKEIANFIHYDAVENGLCFEIKAFMRWVKDISRSEKNDYLTFSNSERIRIEAKTGEICLMVIPNGLTPSFAMNEISLQKRLKTTCTIDENKKLIKLKQSSNKSNLLWILAIGIASITIVGGIIYMCSNK